MPSSLAQVSLYHSNQSHIRTHKSAESLTIPVAACIVPGVQTTRSTQMSHNFIAATQQCRIVPNESTLKKRSSPHVSCQWQRIVEFPPVDSSGCLQPSHSHHPQVKGRDGDQTKHWYRRSERIGQNLNPRALTTYRCMVATVMADVRHFEAGSIGH